MNRKPLIVGVVGCSLLLLLGAVAAVVFAVLPFQYARTADLRQENDSTIIPVVAPGVVATQDAIPTLSANAQIDPPSPSDTSLTTLYEQVNPGVVNIQVFIDEGFGGQGAGSGFILDDNGYIVTNNHVVADAATVTVIFYNGLEAPAEIIGTDDDSDLAVIKVDQLPDGVHPLSLGDSDSVQPGEWVIAIGNPFSLGGSITLGIVSAVGRSLPSGVTPFAIPQAIQTDAAINPGNSGGPLLNLNGEVVGVNAQIRTNNTTGGIASNSGVGFAIPVNVVRQVAPVLMSEGSYQWAWLGVQQPVSVNLLIAQANDLATQRGVYIHAVVPGGPADEAGLQGSTGSTQVNGLTIPTGGDVIVAVNGSPLNSLDELLAAIAFQEPGSELTMTVLRNGEEQQLTATLAARPQEFDQLQP